MNWESQGTALLAELLMASVVRPFALAAAAWVVLRLFGVRHPASRHAVWTAVLVGMILLPFVSVIAPHWKVPVLPRKEVVMRPSVSEIVFTDPAPVALAARQNSYAAKPALPSVQTVVVWVYLAGLFAMVGYRAAGWFLLRRLISRCRTLRGRVLRESKDVLAPLAVGVLRPVVILPTGWREWAAKTKRTVLAHQFSHLRRHDAAVSALAWWVKCLLWFHPLAWWVSRQVSSLAELACDAAALEKAGDPAEYSRMLLGFADIVNRAGRRVALPGLAIAAGSGMDQRIDFAFELARGNMRKLSRPVVSLTLAGVPLLCLAATLGLAQQRSDRPAVTPRFDVASVKLSAAQANGQHGITMHGGPGTPDPTRIAWTNVSVTLILKLALHAYAYQIVRPAWVDSQSYDINATMPPGITKEQFNQMLLNLLEDRFHLTLRREVKEFQGFELVTGKNGAKLRNAAPADSGDAETDVSAPAKTDANGFPVVDRPGVAVAMKMMPGAKVPSVFLTARAQAIGELVHMLGEQLGRPVVDKTGLSGKYDYTLEFPAVESPDAQGEAGPGLLTAVQEQLGLKLEPKKVPLEMLIIDHADKTPTAN